ncbi:MAG TPA: ABC transporter substrate-binding protein [Acetobacteraceae bacterium]|nr:ABC transporter substrate-binding protein [Acetobacteraceae bacterium]
MFWQKRATRNRATSLARAILAAAAIATAPAAAWAAGPATLALVPGITTDAFYITMQRGAAAEAKKLGYPLIWQGGASFSPETQIPVLQALLAKHPGALMIAPTDTTALINPIRQFVQAHIPVIAVDTTITDASLLQSQITSNNIQGGEAAANAIAAFAHQTGEVAVINVKPGISTTDERQKGFLAAIAKYPNMKVAAIEYDDDSPTNAFTEAQLLLLKYPKLKGIFGTNVFSAEGVGKAVVAAGKKGSVDVVGYDAEPDEVTLLKQGVITTLIIQQPAKEGSLAVQYAVDILSGRASAVPKTMQLDNVVATTATADDPKVAQYFYQTQTLP